MSYSILCNSCVQDILQKDNYKKLNKMKTLGYMSKRGFSTRGILIALVCLLYSMKCTECDSHLLPNPSSDPEEVDNICSDDSPPKETIEEKKEDGEVEDDVIHTKSPEKKPLYPRTILLLKRKFREFIMDIKERNEKLKFRFDPKTMSFKPCRNPVPETQGPQEKGKDNLISRFISMVFKKLLNPGVRNPMFEKVRRDFERQKFYAARRAFLS